MSRRSLTSTHIEEFGKNNITLQLYSNKDLDINGNPSNGHGKWVYDNCYSKHIIKWF